jgi:hypothetical protein
MSAEEVKLSPTSDYVLRLTQLIRLRPLIDVVLKVSGFKQLSPL